MRESAFLALAVAAAPLGFALGCAVRPNVDNTTHFASSMQASDAGSTSSRAPKSATRTAPSTVPSQPVDAHSTSAAVLVWRRPDKDELLRRVDNLSQSEAESLCFHLNLIPRDEVFDKVNVKGRLKRYINGLHTDAEIADVEGGFRDLSDHH